MRVRGRSDWPAVVGLVTGGHFLSHFYLLAFPPLFPLWRAEFGLSNTQLGVVMSVVAAATFLQVPVGSLVDRVGGKPVLVAGVALTGLGVALVGTARGYYGILGFALLSGVGQSAFHPADYPLLDAVAGDRQGRSFGVHTFGGYAGYAAAPVVVGTAAGALGWRPVLVIAGAVGLAYALLVGVALGSVHRERLDAAGDDAAPEGGPLDAFTPVMGLVLVLYLVLTAATVGVQTFTPILFVDGFGGAKSLGDATLTAFFALAAGGVLVGGSLADRFSPARLMLALTPLAAVATWIAVGAGAAVGTLAAAAALSAVGLCNGLALPSRDSLVTLAAPGQSVGRSYGVAFTAASVAQLAAPAALGYVIDVDSVGTAFLLVGGLFLAAGTIAGAVILAER
ncbi:MAG: MFS transporter [Haloferacaceae archaeon]